MRDKLLIYTLPLFMALFLFYGFSNVDDPRNESPNSAVTSGPVDNGKLSQRGVPFVEADTIQQAGFPFNRIFNWNYSAIVPINGGTVGAITFNNKWILNKWNAPPTWHRYNNDGTNGGPGTFSDSTNSYNAGTGAIRDLTIAPDGSGTNYLWGGTAGTALYKLDQNGTRIATYTHTGAAYRAIAWDPNRKGFWSSNFAGNIVCRDTNGVVLATITVPATDSVAGKYGLGWDSSTVAGKAHVWVWNQGTRPSIAQANPNGGDEVIRYDLSTGTITGRWVIFRPAPSLYIAGGAEVQVIGGTTYLFVNHQNGAVSGYDISNPIALPANDVGVASISRPLAVENVTSTFNPTATVTNFGSNTQTFNVTMTINPGGYTSTKTVTGLASLANQVVTFDPYTASSVGAYTAKAYSQLGTDTNPNNDTVNKAFTVTNFNYATTGGFSFSNSIPGTGAPSQPEYCWKDTTGSTSLVVNSVNSIPAIFTGSLDDGYWAVALPAGKKIRLGGVAYDSFFVSTNGIVGFARQAGLTSFSPSVTSTNRPAYYPLWQDMNLSVNASYPVNRVSYKINGYQLVITYDRIPEFSPVGTDDYVTYQVVIDLVEPGYTSDSRFVTQLNPTLTGAGYVNFYNADALNAHVVGVQSASGAINSYYRAAYPASPAGPILGASGIAVQFGPDANRLNAECGSASLTLRVLFEGPYTSSTHFNSPVEVLLRKSTAPYEIVDGATAVLDALGNGTFNFTKINAGGESYYIVVKSLISVETWSANPIAFPTGDASYDFTTGVGQAYGSNMRDVSGVSTVYVADVNKDGFIDVTDGALIDNDAFNFTGAYTATDVNWDNFVDITDGGFADNNAFNFISVVRP